MEILNRSLKALRGISDDPIHRYQQEGLELSSETEENEDHHQNANQQSNSLAMDHVADDIVIDLGDEERNQLPLSPQNGGQVERAQEDTDEIIEEIDEGYRKAIENIIHIALYSVLKWTTVIGLVLVVLIVTIKWHLSVMYVLSLVSLVDVYSLADLLRMWRKISDTEKKRYRVKLLQSLLSVVSKISLLAYVYIKPFKLVYSFAPALGVDFLNTLNLVIKNRTNSLRRFYCVQLMLKTFYSALVITISLKLDGLIVWHWREVFMSYWALFGIVIGFTVVIILVFLNKFLSFFLVDRRNFESYGILWLVLLFAGNSVSSCLIVIRLQKVLENQVAPSSLLLIFVLTALYNIALTLFTTIHFKKLEIFFKKFTVTEEEPPLLSSPVSKENENEKPPSPKKLVIPRFLTKSSNTYFRKVTQKDIERSKKQKFKPKQSKFKVKQPRQRQNSFDQSTKNTWVRNAALFSNPDLLTIPETDRDKLKTEMLSTKRNDRRDIKNLNLISKKLSDPNFASQPSDRSRAGLIGSYRSTVNYHTGENSHIEDTYGTQVSARRRDGERIDSFRSLQEGQFLGHLNPDNQDKIEEDEEEQRQDDGLSAFLEDIGHLSARKANSMNAIPEPARGLPLITESASHNENSRVENSRVEGSEMMTSPTLDASTTQQCLICFDKPPDAVFMECGHGGVCYECSLEIWKTTTECYLCRKKINQVLQIDSKHKIGKHIIKVISATQMVLCDNQNQHANVQV